MDGARGMDFGRARKLVWAGPQNLHARRARYPEHDRTNLKSEPSGARQTAEGSPKGEAGRPNQIKNLKSLCSGPGKLTIALGVDGRDNGRDLCTEKRVGFHPPPQPAGVVADVRIGISRAVHFPWRFLLRGSGFVSRKAKGQTAREGRPGLENGDSP